MARDRSRAPRTTASGAMSSVAERVGAAKQRKRQASKRLRLAESQATRESLAKRGGTLTLSDVGERSALSFLSYVPDRIIAERVCKRWQRLSQREVPIHNIDFSTVSMRKVSRAHLKTILARAKGKLTHATLPGFSLDDASLTALKLHTDLRHLHAYSLSNKQIFELLVSCTKLETLELLDCQYLNFVRWEPRLARLSSVRFNACHIIKTPAISSLIAHCGNQLMRLELTGAECVDSSIFRTLAQHATDLREFTISYCRDVRMENLNALLQARCETLRLLDLSSCSGFTDFPDSAMLTALEVLILDNTRVADSALRAISNTASALKYFSLQDCRSVTDLGMIDLSAPGSSCSALRLLDLKGTRVTDVGVEALEAGHQSLDMLRLDSCRNVSRSTRLRHGQRTRQFLQSRINFSYERVAVARIATPEQIVAVAAVVTSESEAEEDSDDSH